MPRTSVPNKAPNTKKHTCVLVYQRYEVSNISGMRLLPPNVDGQYNKGARESNSLHCNEYDEVGAHLHKQLTSGRLAGEKDY